MKNFQFSIFPAACGIPLRRDNFQFLKCNAGQALITLLIFVIIAITVTTAGVAIAIVNSTSANTLQAGVSMHAAAESGAENALIRLIRDPNYTGETMSLGGATVTVTVTGTTTKTITSSAVKGTFKRTIAVVADYTNNILTVTSWKEVF